MHIDMEYLRKLCFFVAVVLFRPCQGEEQDPGDDLGSTKYVVLGLTAAAIGIPILIACLWVMCRHYKKRAEALEDQRRRAAQESTRKKNEIAGANFCDFAYTPSRGPIPPDEMFTGVTIQPFNEAQWAQRHSTKPGSASADLSSDEQTSQSGMKKLPLKKGGLSPLVARGGLTPLAQRGGSRKSPFTPPSVRSPRSATMVTVPPADTTNCADVVEFDLDAQ